MFRCLSYCTTLTLEGKGKEKEGKKEKKKKKVKKGKAFFCCCCCCWDLGYTEYIGLLSNGFQNMRVFVWSVN